MIGRRTPHDSSHKKMEGSRETDDEILADKTEFNVEPTTCTSLSDIATPHFTFPGLTSYLHIQFM